MRGSRHPCASVMHVTVAYELRGRVRGQSTADPDRDADRLPDWSGALSEGRQVKRAG
jgi:hypothetical protein